MPKGNIKFYSIVLMGLILAIALGFLIFFNKQGNNSENILAGSKDVSGQRSELKQSITMSIAEDKNLSSGEKQELENMATNFFSSIGAAESVGSAESIKIADFPQKNLSIFDQPIGKIFPADYLNYVKKMNDLMKKENFALAGAQVEIKKTSDVFDSMGNFLNFSVEKEIVPESNYTNLHNGLTVVWPMTLEMEYGKLQSLKYFNNLSLGGEFGGGIFEKIFSLADNLIPKTFAQAGLCFRFGAPIPGGVNLWAPCCACFAGTVPIGCLNRVCPSGAAIYDQVTGICGCG